MPSPLSGACLFPPVLRTTGRPVLHDLPHFYVADPMSGLSGWSSETKPLPRPFPRLTFPLPAFSHHGGDMLTSPLAYLGVSSSEGWRQLFRGIAGCIRLLRPVTDGEASSSFQSYLRSRALETGAP